MNNSSTLIIAASIIISALIVSFSNIYQPSPINESFVIDSRTGDIYDIQGTNLEQSMPNKNNKVQ